MCNLFVLITGSGSAPDIKDGVLDILQSVMRTNKLHICYSKASSTGECGSKISVSAVVYAQVMVKLTCIREHPHFFPQPE
jgi:hypothetical protein